MTSSDINSGLCLRNPAPCPESATIAATGMGRSGTTMVARILGELGLHMGTRLTLDTFEDKRIQRCLKLRDVEGFETACRARDRDHAKWAFKCPALRVELGTYSAIMRNPRIIVTFRDVLAISLRNQISMDYELSEALIRAIRGYRKLTQQIFDCEHPMLMISYEKALQFPEGTVDAIADFCGLTPTDEQRMSARLTIKNGDPRYLGVVDEIADVSMGR